MAETNRSQGEERLFFKYVGNIREVERSQKALFLLNVEFVNET